MPIYEVRCGECRRDYELFVRTDKDRPRCPGCGSRKAERKVSVFGGLLPGRSAPAPSGGGGA